MSNLTHHTRLTVLAGLALIFVLLAGCSGPRAELTPAATAPQSSTPAGAVDPPTAGPTAANPAPAEPTRPAAEGYWIDPSVPPALAARVAPALEGAGLTPAATAEGAVVTLGPDSGASQLSARWVYALAAPFPTVPDDIAWDAFTQYWLTGSSEGLVGFEQPLQLVLSPDVVAWLTATVGPPAQGLPLQTAEAAELEALAWGSRPSLSILPFDQLTPRWKALRVDGQSIFDKALNTDVYPLTRTIGLQAAGERGQQVAAALQAEGWWPTTNREPTRITIVTLTGVTALVRATAMMMESKGIDYPAQAILPFLQDADILHTSNEVSFSPDCPPPDWVGPPEGFCSSPRYFDLLRTIGLDVVELTGNHLNDIGTGALAYTLDIYDNNGVVYYGGGRDLTDAQTPRIVTAPDGTRVAFVGCNDPGPYTVFATAGSPGAAPCDDWAWMVEAIQRLKAEDQADVVIATVQYWELAGYAPSAEQVADFEQLAAAGADVVLGSQAHQPQGFAFTGGAFIHYGIGNLFFDQMDFIENRQMFADKLILYEGRHIGTVLFTGLMEEWSQPNPMSPEERAAFLEMMFAESGW